MELPSDCFSPLDLEWHASSGHAMRVDDARTRLAPLSAWTSFQELHTGDVPVVVRILWAPFNVKRMSRHRGRRDPPSAAATLASCLGTRGAGAAPRGGGEGNTRRGCSKSQVGHFDSPTARKSGNFAARLLGWAPCGQVCDSPSPHPPSCPPHPPVPSSPSGANHMPQASKKEVCLSLASMRVWRGGVP